MANLSEDIQCASFDTRPPMLDRTDFASWQQRIRLYCRGKENRVNILKSIDEGPFQMGTIRDTLAEGTEGAQQLGPERARVYSDLSPEDKDRTSSNTRNQAIVQDDKVVVQNVQGRQNRGQGKNARGAGASGYRGAQNRVGNANPGQARQIKCYNCNVQDLALNVDNVFQADDCDAFESDVDEAPTTQTMFMENLSSVDPVCDEAGPSYDSNILSEVHDHDHYQDAVCEHYEVHEMHDNYVKDNAVPVVESNVSSVPNDAYMMILNDMYEQPAQYASVTTQNNVVNKSLTAELTTYKEQVKLYERRAKFELTEREQNINEQLRIVIADLLNSEDTLEIAEITRKKMNDKMKDPECVKKRVKIAPHDYSKENYLATFTPQKQLTPE
ncbi:hypothetical protein Tco_0982741 [Tanacetum coccineum]